MNYVYYALGLLLALVPSVFLACTMPHWPARWEDETSQAELMLKINRSDEAIRHLQTAVRLNPSTSTYANLGYVLSATGNDREAEQQLQLALGLSPDNIDVRCFLASFYERHQQYDQARAQYEQVLRQAPGSKAAQWGMGALLMDLGEGERSVAIFRKVAEQNPQDAEAHFYLGNSLFATRRLSEAIGQYQEAQRLAPDNRTVADQLNKAQQALQAARVTTEPGSKQGR